MEKGLDVGEIRSFRELDIWKKGIELVKEVYKLTQNFPSAEIYALTSQMRRSAISVPCNTAEGFKRRHSKEFKQFLSISMGSLAELETQFVIAKDLGYIQHGSDLTAMEMIDHINRMTTNLIKKL